MLSFPCFSAATLIHYSVNHLITRANVDQAPTQQLAGPTVAFTPSPQIWNRNWVQLPPTFMLKFFLCLFLGFSPLYQESFVKDVGLCKGK